MNIVVLGVNYNRTPLAIREKLSFSIEEHSNTLEHLKTFSGVEECSLLSTCNRTEIHIYAQFEHMDTRAIEKFWCEVKGLDSEQMKKYFYLYQGPQAVKHIFKVAAGMDSMILGEDQVLGQFKKAYEMALQVGTTGTVLNTLSRQAITASKKIKTLISEKKNDHSISALVLEQLIAFYGASLSTKTALVIGSGQIGTMVLKKLSDSSLKKLYTTKRNACIQSSQIAELVDYEDRYSVVDVCDIVISATSSPHYTITQDVLSQHIKDVEKHRFYIDLAVPRDFDENIEQLSNIHYLTIDDFRLAEDQFFIKGNVNADYVDAELESCVLAFEKWYNFRELIPVVQEIQSHAKDIVLERLEGAMSPILTLDASHKETIKVSTENALKTVLNQFIYSAQDYVDPEKLPAYFKAMKAALESSIKKGD